MTDEVKIEIVAEDDSAAALEKASTNITQVGAAADKTAPRLRGVSDGLARVGDASQRASRSTGDQATRLDRLGESADTGETRFIGLASGIDGATSLMDDPSPQEMAQGIADLSDGIAKSAVPALKALRDNTGAMLQRLTGADTTLRAVGRAAAFAGGVAGLGLFINAVENAEEKRKQLRIDRLAEEFTALGKVEFSGVLDVFQMEETFDKLLEQSPRLAQSWIDWVEAASDGAAQTEEFQERVDMASRAQDRFAEVTAEAKTNIELEAEATKAFSDELDKLLGKTFSVSEAQANLTVAVADAAETVKANREELGGMATSLDVSTEAGARNVLMIQDLVEAEAERLRALQESGVGNVELANATRTGVAALEEQLTQMGFNREQVKRYTGVLSAVPPLIRTQIGVRGVEQSINDIGRLQREINGLTGRDVHLRIVGTGVGVAAGGARFNAHGGIVGAAVGGIHGGLRIVGEHGPELVRLPTGSNVHSNPDTQRMLAGMGADNRTLTIIVQGTGVLAGLREEIQYDYGGDVQTALGQAV